MDSIAALRKELLEAVDRHWVKARGVDRSGGGLMDPTKLIVEGMWVAREIIEKTPATDDPQEFLRHLKERLAAAADRYRKNPVSQDGWDDEDHWIVGGINTILKEVTSRLA